MATILNPYLDELPSKIDTDWMAKLLGTIAPDDFLVVVTLLCVGEKSLSDLTGNEVLVTLMAAFHQNRLLELLNYYRDSERLNVVT